MRFSSLSVRARNVFKRETKLEMFGGRHRRRRRRQAQRNNNIEPIHDQRRSRAKVRTERARLVQAAAPGSLRRLALLAHALFAATPTGERRTGDAFSSARARSLSHQSRGLSSASFGKLSVVCARSRRPWPCRLRANGSALDRQAPPPASQPAKPDGKQLGRRRESRPRAPAVARRKPH